MLCMRGHCVNEIYLVAEHPVPLYSLFKVEQWWFCALTPSLKNLHMYLCVCMCGCVYILYRVAKALLGHCKLKISPHS